MSIKVTGKIIEPGPGVKALNPELYSQPNVITSGGIVQPAPKLKRLRQSSRPVLNKLESDWLAYLKDTYPGENFRFQDRRYLLANGVWYKPDITCQFHHLEDHPLLVETAWECKEFRGKNVDRGIVMLKVAAHVWPEIKWMIVWRQDGEWNEQEVFA